MIEEWKCYKDSRYMVSNTGRVKSISSSGKSVIMAAQTTNKGYLRVNLRVFGGRYIHRLVAEVFITNPLNLPQINHIDCNKKNNNYNNIEWVTGDKNIEHAIKNGLGTPHQPIVAVDKDNIVIGEFTSKEAAKKGVRGIRWRILIHKELYSKEYAASLIKERLSIERKKCERYIPSNGRKLSLEQVLAIRKLLECDEYYDQRVAKIFGVMANVVKLIRLGKTYTDY